MKTVITRVLLILTMVGVDLCAISQGKYLETVKVTDSIYVFKPKIDWTHSNGVAIIGSDGVFFIDTYIESTYAAEAIKRLKEITKLPIKYVLNTHWHYDHVIGNYEFKKAFPGCKFIMHDSTYKYVNKMVKPYIDSDFVSTKQTIAQLEKEIKQKKTGNGAELTGAMLPFWDWQLREANEYYKNYRPLQLVNADITFSDTLTFRWGSQTIQMIYLPEAGHSEGDVIAWIPEKKVVITGDIVVAPTPYNTHKKSYGMLKALQRIIDMSPAIIIPGHGVVEYDQSYINLEKEAFIAYVRETENAIKN